MAYLCFSLESIPDLSLSKYASLDENGVDGVLKKLTIFLRQLNRKGIMSTVFFHLIYIYDPDSDKGNQLKIYFIASGEKDKLIRIRESIQSSPISAFYDFVSVERVSITNIKETDKGLIVTLQNHFNHDAEEFYISHENTAPSKEKIVEYKDKPYCTAKIKNGKILSVEDDGCISNEEESLGLLKNIRTSYDYMAALGKREFFVQPSIKLPDIEDINYYKVAEWEMNDGARLYDMFKTMQCYKKSAAFRVDIFPVDYASGLRKVLPIQDLRNWTSIHVTKHATTITANRDENAEKTLKQYNDLIEKYESAPHFRANILAFANEQDIAVSIVDAAGAESLKSGNYVIKIFSADRDFKGNLDIYSSMTIIDVAGKNTFTNLRFMPNLYLLDELRPFFTLPALYDGEVIEIPKETAPKQPESKSVLKIGVDENNYDVFIPIKLLKKHVFLAGVPGSGKTNSMLHLATELWKPPHKIPFLILEPAKKEYRSLARIEGMDDLLIFSPFSGTKFPLHINPFEFPCGMPLSEHIRNLMAVFEGAFTLGPPAPFMIDNAIEAVYREKGWYPDTINESKLPYPTMSELYEKLEDEVEKTDYDSELKGNLRSVLQVRIGSLLRREMGDVFDVPKSSLAPEEWLTVPALIELEAMGSGPANFLTLLLSTLIRESLKVKPSAGGKNLRHAIFFEEAHNLIGPQASEVTGEDADPKLAATAYIVKMLAEVRALNEGIIIADQLPTKLAPEVIKNTGLKIGHRLTAEDDRNLLGSTMSASAVQLEQMATFEVGSALVTFEGLLRPFKIKVEKWQKEDALYEPVSDEELLRLLIEPKKAGYDHLLRRSSEICYAKFETKNLTLKSEMEKFLTDLDKSKRDADEIEKFRVDHNLSFNDVYDSDKNNDDPLITKFRKSMKSLSDETKDLANRLNELFSAIKELFMKTKGYYNQNLLYNRQILKIIEHLKYYWSILITNVKEKRNSPHFNKIIEKYEDFSIEINKTFVD